ncbi:hypothetical protein ACW0US_17660 [Xanthomonas euvesicatoria]
MNRSAPRSDNSGQEQLFSPAEREWFGASKACHADGSAKILFMGSTGGAAATPEACRDQWLRIGNRPYLGEGFYVHDSADIARAQVGGWSRDPRRPAAMANPVLLRMEDPLIIDDTLGDPMHEGVCRVREELIALLALDPQEVSALGRGDAAAQRNDGWCMPSEMIMDVLGERRFGELVRGAGFDGIIVRASHMAMCADEYIVFDADQVRMLDRPELVPAAHEDSPAQDLGIKTHGPQQLVTKDQLKNLLKAWDTTPELPATGKPRVVVFPPSSTHPVAVLSMTDRKPSDARSGKLFMVEFGAVHAIEDPSNDPTDGCRPRP